MKGKFLVSWTLALILTFSLTSTALYAFTNSFLYSPVREYIESLLPSFMPSFQIVLPLILGFLGLLFLKRSAADGMGWIRKFTGALVFMSVPIILPFSSHSWLDVWGLKTATDLSFGETSIIVGFLVLGHFLLYYFIRHIRGCSELLDSNVDEEEIDKFKFKKGFWIFGILVLAFIASNGVFLTSIYLRSSISGLITSIPIHSFVIGMGVSVGTIMVLYFVLSRKVGIFS